MSAIEEKPELQQGKKGIAPRWKPARGVEDKALLILGDVVSTFGRASDADLEKLYEKGYLLYNAGKYQDAIPFFEMLMSIHPKEPKYLMAVGACHHMMKNLDIAYQFYLLVSMVDPDTPIPFYHATDCLMKMKQPFLALVQIEMGLKRSEGKPEYKMIHDRMAAMGRKLKRELTRKMEESHQSLKPD
jgi:type III secretion system low calcium response chaperone LcrH/SycD